MAVVEDGVQKFLGQPMSKIQMLTVEATLRGLIRTKLVDIFEGDMHRVDRAMQQLVIKSTQIHDAVTLDVDFLEDFQL